MLTLKQGHMKRQSHTHHHIGPHLPESLDQMGVMIVFHLPQNSCHTGHEVSLQTDHKSQLDKQGTTPKSCYSLTGPSLASLLL